MATVGVKGLKSEISDHPGNNTAISIICYIY